MPGKYGPTILDKSVGTHALFLWKLSLFDFPLPLSKLNQRAESALFRSNIDQGGGGTSLCANVTLQSVENRAISEHLSYFQAVPRTFVQDCSYIRTGLEVYSKADHFGSCVVLAWRSQSRLIQFRDQQLGSATTFGQYTIFHYFRAATLLGVYCCRGGDCGCLSGWRCPPVLLLQKVSDSTWVLSVLNIDCPTVTGTATAIERLERARPPTSLTPVLRAVAHLARSSLSITKRTERDCVQSSPKRAPVMVIVFKRICYEIESLKPWRL